MEPNLEHSYSTTSCMQRQRADLWSALANSRQCWIWDLCGMTAHQCFCFALLVRSMCWWEPRFFTIFQSYLKRAQGSCDCHRWLQGKWKSVAHRGATWVAIVSRKRLWDVHRFDSPRSSSENWGGRRWDEAYVPKGTRRAKCSQGSELRRAQCLDGRKRCRWIVVVKIYFPKGIRRAWVQYPGPKSRDKKIRFEAPEADEDRKDSTGLKVENVRLRSWRWWDEWGWCKEDPLRTLSAKS